MACKKKSGPELPAEFLELGERLYQGFDDNFHSVDDYIHHLAGGFSEAEATKLRAFLVTIVESAKSDELARMWNRVVRDYYFHDGEEIRRMFALVRDKLGQGRMRPGWQPVG